MQTIRAVGLLGAVFALAGVICNCYCWKHDLVRASLTSEGARNMHLYVPQVLPGVYAQNQMPTSQASHWSWMPEALAHPLVKVQSQTPLEPDARRARHVHEATMTGFTGGALVLTVVGILSFASNRSMRRTQRRDQYTVEFQMHAPEIAGAFPGALKSRMGPISMTTSASDGGAARWKLRVSVGREPITSMPKEWAKSGARLLFSLPVDVFPTQTASPDDERRVGPKARAIEPREPVISITGFGGVVEIPVRGGGWNVDAEGKLSFWLEVPESITPRNAGGDVKE